MFKEPYDTSVLRRYDVKQLTEQLETNFVQGNLHPVVVPAAHDDELVGVVYEILPGSDSIDPMEAPKLITTREGVKVVIDSRATKSVGRDGAVSRISSPADYQFSLREAILTHLWQHDAAVFSQLGELPIRVYAHWISDAIVRRLGLDGMDRIRLQIAAAYFYVCSFHAEPLDEGRQLGVSTLISRALSIPLQHVVGIANQYGYIADMPDFVAKIKSFEATNPRVSQITVALVYTLLQGSWFGARKSLIITTALEYPPTFLTMLLTAFTDRSYHASYFAKTAQEADKAGKSRSFVLAMNHISKGLTDG